VCNLLLSGRVAGVALCTAFTGSLLESMLRAGLTKRKEQGPLPADMLRIVIRNCGRRVESGHAENGNEIGIGNTEERLKTLDGTDFEFSLAWLKTGGCEFVLELPLRRAPNLQEAPSCVL
jgi:hypothetical protein